MHLKSSLVDGRPLGEVLVEEAYAEVSAKQLDGKATNIPLPFCCHLWCDQMSLLTDSLPNIILQELVIILCLSQKQLNSSKNSASWAFCLEREKQICVSVLCSILLCSPHGDTLSLWTTSSPFSSFHMVQCFVRCLVGEVWSSQQD